MATVSNAAHVRPRRAWPSALSAPACALLALALAGCPAASNELEPPRDIMYFPTALALSPDGSRMFVVTSNADLRYNSGSVVLVDLDEVSSLVDAWRDTRELPRSSCQRDPLDPAVLSCPQTEVIVDDGRGNVRIGNFATTVDVQERDDGSLRLLVPVRGDPSVAWIDYRDDELQCGDSGEEVPLCDDQRVLYRNGDPDDQALRLEPFDVFVSQGAGGDYAVVTHLDRAAASLIALPADGDPVLVDEISDLFSINSLGVQAAVGVAGRPLPATGESLLYVTSRSEARIQMLAIKPGASPRLVPVDFFFLDSVSGSSDSRGIVFDAEAERAYIANRSPAMLHVLDTSLRADGMPRNQPLTNVELCRDPANVVVGDTGAGPRAYVACFPAGEVWAVDPERSRVEAIFSTGGGAHALALDEARGLLYVTNFLEHSLAVVDIRPASTTYNQVVLRLQAPLED